VKLALHKAIHAGATREKYFEDAKHGSAALCADPFGNGLCVLERKST
jgi:hypothetical protein